MRPGEGQAVRPGIGRARRGFRGAGRRLRQAEMQRVMPDPSAQPPAAVPVPQVDPYDPSADPTLQRIRAFGAQRLAEAQAAAINARTQEATDYGGVQAQDTREQHDQPIQLSAQQSRQNLGYSSTGAVQQSDLSRALAATAAQHGREHEDRLRSIQDALTGVQQDVASSNIQAQQDAADRLQQQLGDLNVAGGGQHRNLQGAHAMSHVPAQALARQLRAHLHLGPRRGHR